MRGPGAEHNVERLLGHELFGFSVMQDEAVSDAEVECRAGRVREGGLGDVHALGVRIRSCGQGAQEPFPSAAAEVEHPLVALF